LVHSNRPGWRSSTLGNLVFFQRGFDITKADQKSGNIPVVSSSGINSYHSEAKVVGPGVIIGRKGSLGTVHYVEGPYWPHDTTLWSKDLRGNDPRFVFYFLQTMGLERYDVGNSNPTLNRNHIHGLKISIPDIQIQKKIAINLLAYDDLIENNKRRIQLLEQSARLLYKEWFVHLRFPGHEHVKITIGEPEGWKKLPLGDLLTLQRGFDLPLKHRKEGPYPVYASTGINGFHETAKVKGPGVVTGRSGSLGHVMYVPEDFWPLNTSLWVKDFKQVGPLYALHLLSEMHLEQYNGGAAVPTLNRNDVHRVEQLCPNSQILRLFDEYTIPVYRQIETLERCNRALQIARDLLLPRLMNGEITI
jgi:type I restriction enzyme, S subunit